MKPNAKSKHIGDLIGLLGQLRTLYERLSEVVQCKLAAMKRADMAVMHRLTQEEHTLTDRLQERNGLRRQFMDLVGRQFDLPAGEARSLTLSQLSTRVPEPERTKLLDAGGALREVMSQVAQLNRVAGIASREILNHLRSVASAIRPRVDEPAGYTGKGGLVSPSGTAIFETVG
ncbi:MAG: flagellar protein FlgN [Planctomycetes bacterium]|nr:flagellar protein FlgN [Planctomycetota bacterium]